MLDPHVLKLLKDLEATSPGLLARLIQAFQEDTPKRIAAIEHALHSGDMDEAARAAHSLKGSSANLGAHQLSARCADLKVELANGNMKGAKACGVQLKSDFERVQASLLARPQ